MYLGKLSERKEGSTFTPEQDGREVNTVNQDAPMDKMRPTAAARNSARNSLERNRMGNT